MVLLQAVFYGLNHIAFGPPALLGKTVLGLALGGAALLGGCLASLLAHLAYQYLVQRQFAPARTPTGESP